MTRRKSLARAWTRYRPQNEPKAKENICGAAGHMWAHVCVLSQGESELVAKDDNLDAADPNEDKKTQDRDEEMDEEEKEKINEQGDQVISHHPLT